MRRPILIANWKMHKGVAEALAFVDSLLPQIAEADGVDVVIAPSFTALAPVGARLAGTPVALAAQNVHPVREGAFTGEISVGQLADAGCRYAIVGHSERRGLFGESDEQVAAKAAALIAADLHAIVCVGETLEEHETGRTAAVVGSQLEGSVAGLDEAAAERLMIAYEPVWAIGTGRTATPETAQDVHAFIRERLRDLFGDASMRMRIQYGGSVKPENVYALMAQPDIDGALVGGASLDPDAFARIVHFEAQESSS